MSEMNSPGWDPLPRVRAHEQVLAAIEDRLRSRVVQAGDRLPPEREFAKALGVSRGAVREALRVLEALGAVEACTGSGSNAGSMITTNSTAGMALVMRLHFTLASLPQRDLIETRLGIESSAAAEAAEKAGAEDVARLSACIEGMRGAHTADRYLALDREFHLQMVQLSGNEFAAALISALRDAEQHNVITTLSQHADFGATTKVLTARLAVLVETIAARDPRCAAELAEEHIRAFYSALDM